MVINPENKPFSASKYCNEPWAKVSYSYGMWPDSLCDEVIDIFKILVANLEDKRNMRFEISELVKELKHTSNEKSRKENNKFVLTCFIMMVIVTLSLAFNL